MAVVYRAMWDADDAEIVERAYTAFAHWAATKCDDDVEIPDGGEVSVGGNTISVERAGPAAEDGIADALKARLVEQRDDGERWTTTIQAWTGSACAEDPLADGLGRFWVDVESVTHDTFQRITVHAPRLVRDLLAVPGARRGLPLSPRVTAFSGSDRGERLAELLSDVDRDLPVVVFAPPADELDPGLAADVEDAMGHAARACAGMAFVACVDAAAIEALNEALTTGYSVWGGAFRIYQPGLDPADDRPTRHRYVLPERYTSRRAGATEIIVRSISPFALSRRPEPSHDRARASLHRRFVARLQSADPQVARLGREKLRLEGDLEAANELMSQAESDRVALVEERNGLRDEVGNLQRRLARSLQALREHGLAGADAPEWATHPSHAVELAREYLGDRLTIPDAACVDLDDLDSAVPAQPWGQDVWRALRALHAYAGALATEQAGQAGQAGLSSPGTFWTWCANSGHERAWPATPKKLAMTESEPVRTNPKLAVHRLLPVHTSVAAGGRIEMLAHIKIAEGGGNLAPRIYFHVDDRSATVHVGYLGPHKHMPNTLT